MNNSSSSIPPNTMLADAKDALGWDILNGFVSLILYGIMINQFYKYCRAFPSDSAFIRTLLGAVLILETIQAALTMHYLYFFLITNFTDPGAVARGSWSVNVNILAAALTMVVSQIFFIGRIYMIGGRYRIFAIVATILSLGEVVTATYIMHGLLKNTLQDNVMQMKWCIGASMLTPTIMDAFLTSALILVLRRTRAGLKRSDSVVDLVMVYGVNTGFLHLVLNLAAFVSFISVSNPFTSQVYGPFNAAAVRVYAITFLSVLNSRETKGTVAVFDSGSYGLKVIERINRRVAAETWNVPQVPDEEPAAINIRVTTELEDGRNWSEAKMTTTRTSSGELGCTF